MIPTLRDLVLRVTGVEDIKHDAIELLKCGRDASYKHAKAILENIPEEDREICREYGVAMMKVGEAEILNQLQKLLTNVSPENAKKLIEIELKSCKSMLGGNFNG